jgi:glycosyltransferase involved in cell wall biosynthesis
MSITLILHEATRTGAPRYGALIAQGLQRHEDVDTIVLRDGPLTPWLKDTLGEDRVVVCEGEAFSYRVTFKQRVDQARALLEERQSDMVYVNSVAASPFLVAAKLLGRHAVLHVHEKAGELYSLLRLDATKLDVLPLADAVLLAAEGMRQDILTVFGFQPERIQNFGIAIDTASVREQALDEDAVALNADGEQIQWGKRFVVGMCGHASPRKGTDIFLQVAAELPEIDFVWIGGWTLEDAPENPAMEDFERLKLKNFYVTGGVDNPYKYLGRLGMFFLSSREDPNPLVLAECTVLRVPILCFSGTTAVTEELGRRAIVCYGKPNVPDAVRVLRAVDPALVLSDSFKGLTDEAAASFDSKAKVDAIFELLSDVRAEEASVS